MSWNTIERTIADAETTLRSRRRRDRTRGLPNNSMQWTALRAAAAAGSSGDQS